MLHIWGLSFWVQPFHARFPLPARLPPHHCSVRICCPFCTFVKAIVTFFSLPKPASRHSRQKRHTDNDKSNCQWLVVLLLYIFCPSNVCVCECVWLSILCSLPKSNCQLAQRFALLLLLLLPLSSFCLLPFDFVRVLLLSGAACSCQLPLAASCCI